MNKGWAALIGAAAITTAVACGTGGTDSDTNPVPPGDGGATEPDNEIETEPTNRGRDGEFEFTVNGMECGVQSAVDEYDFTYQPDEQYCVVAIRIDNIGTEAAEIDTQEFYGLDAAGTKYDSDSDLWVYDTLNPGQGRDVEVYYDIPESVELKTLELHDNFMSLGVEVAIP